MKAKLLALLFLRNKKFLFSIRKNSNLRLLFLTEFVIILPNKIYFD